ncbi:MAG: cytochrome c oxidase accessory protein CcoG, partial [Gammaproteobacteria bacterium]|nr:cytochrome c oxidase accessory protein CcoG [Gammaproteobacteria bacterium]
ALHPTAADNRVQAAGTITLGGVGEVAAPLPKFATDELGDCIACTLCVQVCPTGIDIRNGLQYECIACGACIDACDAVMDKMGFERGLIRYSTQNAIDSKPTRVLRPRVLVYGTLLAGLMIAWVVGVNMRSPLIVEVLRDRNALYRVVGGGEVENDYTLKLVNKSDESAVYRIRIEGGPAGIELRGSGLDAVHAAPQQVLSVPVIVAAPDSVKGRQPLVFHVESADGGASETVDSSFFGPL